MDDNALSVHALEGSHGIDTTRMLGLHKNRQLMILIDNGNTTNFLDKRIAKELKLEFVPTPFIAIKAADGRKLGCNLKCQQFRWKMQGYEFTSDPKILELRGFDMILGVDWLRIHNPVLFDFQASSIIITSEGQSVVLQGIGEGKLQSGIWCSNDLLNRKGKDFQSPLFLYHGY